MRSTVVYASLLLSLPLALAPITHAEPPPFPDLAAYSPVNPDDYKVDASSPGHPDAKQTYFISPDGAVCSFLNSSAGCSGDNLPGIQQKDKNPYTFVSTNGGIQKASNAPYSERTIQQANSLPPLHSITVNGVVCGVDDAGLTACKDPQGRGFVLSPQGSHWLPHV
ncbi:hypothetical protein [Mycobacterium sp. NPDC050853]|uniref:hypothetical protein n=1 Tax=Mycobacterium sp. NPDC050853 TaxID=3155160 RepID=UPI0033F38F33